MIGRKVREARIAAGMTQEQLAENCFSRSYIAAIENGHCKPSAESLSILAEKLNRPLEFFLPSRVEVDEKQACALMWLTEAALELNDGERLSRLLPSVQKLNENASDPSVLARANWLISRAEQANGSWQAAIRLAILAHDAYLRLQREDDAWRCAYLLAHALHTAGQYELAGEIALKSLLAVSGRRERLDMAERSCHLLVVANYACGRLEVAKEYCQLSHALERDSATGKLGAELLLERAAIAHAEEDWSAAARLSRQAACLSLAREHSGQEMRLRAKVVASLLRCESDRTDLSRSRGASAAGCTDRHGQSAARFPPSQSSASASSSHDQPTRSPGRCENDWDRARLPELGTACAGAPAALFTDCLIGLNPSPAEPGVAYRALVLAAGLLEERGDAAGALQVLKRALQLGEEFAW